MTHAKTQVYLGLLVAMSESRLSRLHGDDFHVCAERLVAYVAKTLLGDDPTEGEVLELYSTLNDILHGGIVIPEELTLKGENE